jgi:hypothetical protein
MIIVLAPYLQELLARPAAERLAEASQASRRETRTEVLAKENATANALQRAIEEAKQRMLDPVLLLATDCYLHLLVPAFRFYVGKSSWDLPAAEFEKSPTLDPLTIAENYFVKHLPWGVSDYGRMLADPTLRARRGWTGQPPGWRPRGPARSIWERSSASNLVANGPVPMRGVRNG